MPNASTQPRRGQKSGNSSGDYRSRSGNSEGGYRGGNSGGYSSNRGNSRGGYQGGNSRGYQGGRGNSSSGRNFGGGNGGRRKFKAQDIDPALFVKKATPIEESKYTSVNKFTDFAIETSLKDNILKRGYTDPTPIQDKIIPIILSGKDVIGIANTGTGKTAAFLIPLINKILGDNSQKALIIVPTRELAIQIKEELFAFTPGMPIRSVVCIGGADIRRQIQGLRQGFNFVISTPGRLKDLLTRRALRLDLFNNIVLDEVDRMLDMGFYPEIKLLIDNMPKEKQSLFFSATLNPKIESIANTFLTNPERIVVKSQESSANVDQDVIRLTRDENKLEKLHELLQAEDFSRVLIFIQTKRGAERLQKDLWDKGHRVESIHGDKSQVKRQKALASFKMGHSSVLIATDVVARGIDIPDVTHVINYDLPNTYDDYIHRIGRTGRANKTGKALTFIEPRR